MRKLVLACCSIALLTGCGAIEDALGANEPPVPVASSQSPTIEPAKSPDPQAIDKVNSLFSVSPTVTQAQGLAVVQCMKDRGFSMKRPPIANTIPMTLPYAPLSVDTARRYGYDSPEGASEGEGDPSEDAGMSEEDSLKMGEALTGTMESGAVKVPGISGAINRDGCLAHSYEAVFGSAEAGVVFIGAAANLTRPYANTAKFDLDDLVDQWAACMKRDHNLVVRSPDSLDVDLPQVDQAVALDDAQRRAKLDFDAKVRNTTNAYMTTFLHDKEEILDQVATAKKAAEENAPKILGR